MTGKELETILREIEVKRALGISSSTLRRWCEDGRFIRPVYLRGTRIKGWKKTEVQQWIEDNYREKGE